MHVYFVRHGTTDAGNRYRHQSPNAPLSVKGREEALGVAEYLRAMNPDYLVTSEYTRALETARIIGNFIGQSPTTNGLFYELERPSELFNTSIFTFKTMWYAFFSLVYRNNPSWRYKDAENFNDIQKRAERALMYLKSLSKTHQSVVVVSHTIFINIMMVYMCEERMLGLRDLIRVILNMRRLKNGFVMHVEYNETENKNTCAWHPVLS